MPNPLLEEHAVCHWWGNTCSIERATVSSKDWLGSAQRRCGLVGQSACLVNRRSWVQIPAVPETFYLTLPEETSQGINTLLFIYLKNSTRSQRQSPGFQTPQIPHVRECESICGEQAQSWKTPHPNPNSLRIYCQPPRTRHSWTPSYLLSSSVWGAWTLLWSQVNILRLTMIEYWLDDFLDECLISWKNNTNVKSVKAPSSINRPSSPHKNTIHTG